MGGRMRVRSGWSERFRAVFRYCHLRLVRNAGAPEYIGRGVALGLFVGFFIPICFQIVVVIPLAFLLRAAKVPAVAFTFVSNHFSIIVLYPLQCYLGSYLIFRPFRYAELEARLRQVIVERSWSAFRALGNDVVLSFFAGGLLLGAVAAVAGYWITVRQVRRYREKREARLAAVRKDGEKLKSTENDVILSGPAEMPAVPPLQPQSKER